MRFFIERVVRGLFFFAAGFALGTAIIFAFAGSASQVNQAVRGQVMKVVGVRGSASAFAIVSPTTGRPLIITNNHVCQGVGRDGSISLANGNDTFTVPVLRSEESMDLCVAEGLHFLTGLTLADGKVGEGIHVIGHPMGFPIKHSFGYITSREIIPMPGIADPDGITLIDSFITSALALPGNSGSPVVDDDAKVVGVLFASDGVTSLIIPTECVREIITGL